jgi:kinesin family protein C2/C3
VARTLALAQQEQVLFEQRLCDDPGGIAVRKINHNGKANLRYVKCVAVEELMDAKSNKSVASKSVGSVGQHRPDALSDSGLSNPSRKALVWGKKKHAAVSLDQFVAVVKGKTTERTRRNPSPAVRLLTLITKPGQPSLDMEAPTKLDRDKFARAFSRFLQVPLEGDDDPPSIQSISDNVTPVTKMSLTTNEKTNSPHPPSTPSPASPLSPTVQVGKHRPLHHNPSTHWTTPPIPAATPMPTTDTYSDKSQGGAKQVSVSNHSHTTPRSSTLFESSHRTSHGDQIVEILPSPQSNDDPVIVRRERRKRTNADDDDYDDDYDEASRMSSLTGHGYDQEIVEELHQALNELRAELDASRAEASRAVKVAEQAIQSAEKSNSAEWQNTVTHKAAEAAAVAQKRSAEAMAQTRLAEERLEAERRTVAFWKKQVDAAEREAGLLQTRVAAAEVQRASVEERLESLRVSSASQIEQIKARFTASESSQRKALDTAVQRNCALEMELERMRLDLAKHQDRYEEKESSVTKNRKVKKLSLMGSGHWKKKAAGGGDSKSLSNNSSTVSISSDVVQPQTSSTKIPTAQILHQLQDKTTQLRREYELMRRTTAAEMASLPQAAEEWAKQVSVALQTSGSEVTRLRERLALESVSRRKLQHEVQDLRGVVRVYCRTTAPTDSNAAKLMSHPSQETLLLHRGKNVGDLTPLSYDFDRVFDSQASQDDLYAELEDVCLGVLDGYNVCILAYGQSGTGKTRTILGDVKVSANAGSEISVSLENHGMQLQAMRQLFSIADHRSDGIQDTFTLTIVEVCNERLTDLVAGTPTGDARGQVVRVDSTRKSARSNRSSEEDTSLGRTAKLEIRSDVHGDTIIQGAVAVQVCNLEEVVCVWKECLENSEARSMDCSHVIATIKVASKNVATGLGTVGRLQFVDFAGADLTPVRSNSSRKSSPLQDDRARSPGSSIDEWRFVNRSLVTLADVVTARSQFLQSVPYRNSTITHLLRDSLEGDTKVLLIACVSSEPKDLLETISTLRFASQMRRVHVGVATKHSLTPP